MQCEAADALQKFPDMNKIFTRLKVPTVIAVVIVFGGFVNLATGVGDVFRLDAGRYLEQMPEYLRMSAGRQLSGVLTIFFGLMLMALGHGLYRREHRAWAGALLLLALLLGNNLYRGTVPASMLCGLLILGLVILRREFYVRPAPRLDYPQLAAIAAVLFALSYGIVGSYVMRTEFTGIATWTDAVYFTFVTFSTLGYGDMLPETANARVFVVSMIVVGLGSFVTAITVVAGPMIEQRLKGVLNIVSRFQRTRNHVVVCGYSSVAESILDELQERGVEYLVIDDRPDMIDYLRGKGHDVMLGDPTRRETLSQANLAGAQAVIAAFDSDSVNTLVVMTARELRESGKDTQFRIIARVEDEENVEKVRHIGIDEVISPSTLGGRMMAAKAVESG